MDTGDVGSVRELALVHYQTKKHELELHQLMVHISASLHPHAKDTKALNNAISSLLDFIEGGPNKTDVVDKASEDIKNMLDYMDNIKISQGKK